MKSKCLCCNGKGKIKLLAIDDGYDECAWCAGDGVF